MIISIRVRDNGTGKALEKEPLVTDHRQIKRRYIILGVTAQQLEVRRRSRKVFFHPAGKAQLFRTSMGTARLGCEEASFSEH